MLALRMLALILSISSRNCHLYTNHENEESRVQSICVIARAIGVNIFVQSLCVWRVLM